MTDSTGNLLPLQDIDTWLDAALPEALSLQRPLADVAVVIGGHGKKQDGPEFLL